MDIKRRYQTASIKTAASLKAIASSQSVRGVSKLSLPEIEEVANLIARIVPAGNVPGVILTGLARLPGRKIPLKNLKRDISLLFTGVEQMLDTTLQGAALIGPAAVLGAYQLILKLSGRHPDNAFPEGTWQFYAGYALREDTARHTNETHGFDTALQQHNIQLAEVDRLTAWAMTAIHTLHQYDALLENQWRERVFTALLLETTAGHLTPNPYANLHCVWQQKLPYRRGQDASQRSYPLYRKETFDAFLNAVTKDLPLKLHQNWKKKTRTEEREALLAYQRQMSILAYLSPSDYSETRTRIPLEKVYVGLICKGRYYLISACTAGTQQPATLEAVRSQIATIFHGPAADGRANGLLCLSSVRRPASFALRGQFPLPLKRELEALQLAPILINADQRPRALPLSELRQAERGIGDHALTIFQTGETFIFDQSHIFFDGAWGAALAEIMTNEALSWAVHLKSLPPVQPGTRTPFTLRVPLRPADEKAIRQAPTATPETGAETCAVNVKAMFSLRKIFKRRSDLIQLTVNDLLVLYRAIHGYTYKPPSRLLAELRSLAAHPSTEKAAKAALEAIAPKHKKNPAILIPVDASQQNPRERLFPMTFEVPLKELKLLALHAKTLESLTAYQSATGERNAQYKRFDRLQRRYLAALAGFGKVLSHTKAIATRGESASVGTIKLLAYLSEPLQQMINKIPDRIEFLNDILKGREVFSNIGVAAQNSTLTRFNSAKDDNERKALVWGIITDANKVMHISLRDFRPHVVMLKNAGREDLAKWITRDYLKGYADGLNQYVAELHRITVSSRDTSLE